MSWYQNWCHQTHRQKRVFYQSSSHTVLKDLGCDNIVAKSANLPRVLNLELLLLSQKSVKDINHILQVLHLLQKHPGVKYACSLKQHIQVSVYPEKQWLSTVSHQTAPLQHFQVKCRAHGYISRHFFNKFPGACAFAILNCSSLLVLPVSDWSALQSPECFRALLSVKSLQAVWVFGGTAFKL